MTGQPIIIDTDVGTDVDDSIALLLACVSEEIDLVGVTTVGGETAKRAKLARKLLDFCGKEEVPLYPGTDNRLLTYENNYFRAYDGHGISTEDVKAGEIEETQAVEYLLESSDRDKDVSLLTIGPLSNVAIALLLGADFKRLVIMGGSFWADEREYNTSSDPQAAKIMIDQEIPTTFVGLDVTTKVVNGPEEMKRLGDCDTPLTNLAHSMLKDYQAKLGKEFNYLHDPLALACFFNKSFVEFEKVPVEIDLEGRKVRVMEGGGEKKVARDVEESRFMKFLIDRLRKF